jgi:hypothetical protein
VREKSSGFKKKKKGEKVILSELINKVAELSLRQGAHTPWIVYNGRVGEDAHKFVEQFRAFREEWSDRQYLCMIRNHLKGEALLWFKGAEGLLFVSVAEFEREFLEMFGISECHGNIPLLKLLKNSILKPGRVTGTLMELFSVHKTASISLEELLETITSRADRGIRKRLLSCNTWKDDFF